MKNLKRKNIRLWKEPKKKTSLVRKLIYVEILILFFSILWLGGVIWSKVIPHPIQTIHYHAGFIVVKDSQLVDFSGSQYMDVEPCKLKPNQTEVKSPVQQQISKAHLHDGVDNVVHVENSDSLWKDLFTNIDYPIDYQNATAFINGSKVQDFQDQKIQAYQSLVLFIGSGNDTKKFLAQAVTKQHIQDVEKKSEDCGSHG